MEWDKLTAPDFAKAVKKSKRVCLLPIGCIEKHGGHLPLGTDSMIIHKICCLAAEKEPALVFPYFYLSQISEARHQPGTIAIGINLLIPLLENICDEIGRNGLKKILIVNGHGGNINFLSFFRTLFCEKKKDYTVYIVTPFTTINISELKGFQSKIDLHGGESETSQMIHLYPELVKSSIPIGNGMPQKHLASQKGLKIETGIDWYSDYPEHLAADKTPASAKKGELSVKIQVEKLVNQIRIVKKDKTTQDLFKKFHKDSTSLLT